MTLTSTTKVLRTIHELLAASHSIVIAKWGVTEILALVLQSVLIPKADTRLALDFVFCYKESVHIFKPGISYSLP